MQLSVNNELTLPSRLSLIDGEIWLWDDGTWFPVVSGGDGDENEEEEDEDNEDEENDDDDKSKSKSKSSKNLSQEDVRRIAAREKREGKASGRKELLKSLGFESEDDLKAIVEKHREAQDAKKTEAELAAEKAAKDRSDASTERAQAVREKNVARCERALLRADLPEKILDRAVRLLDLDLTDDIEMDDVKDAVKELKKDMPQLFKQSEEDDEDEESGESSNSGGNRNSDPRQRRKPKEDKRSSSEKAKEILDRRHPNRGKESVNTGSRGGS